MSSDDTPQIPVDAPQPSDRVDIVPPEVEEPAPSYTPPSSDAPAVDDFAAEHPEALVAGAFAGAFLFAKLLKRISGG